MEYGIDGQVEDLQTLVKENSEEVTNITVQLSSQINSLFGKASLESSSKDLPQIYQPFTNNLPSLPNTYQQLTKIFFQFAKDLPQIYQQIFGVKYFLIFRK